MSNIHTTHVYPNGITLRHNLDSGHVETVRLSSSVHPQGPTFIVTDPLLATTLGAAPWLAKIPSRQQVRDLHTVALASENTAGTVRSDTRDTKLTKHLSEIVSTDHTKLTREQRLRLVEHTSDSLGLPGNRFPMEEDLRAQAVAEASYTHHYLFFTPAYGWSSKAVLTIGVENDPGSGQLLRAARLMWPCGDIKETTETDEEFNAALQDVLNILTSDAPEMIEMLIIASKSRGVDDSDNAVVVVQQRLTEIQQDQKVAAQHSANSTS